MVVLFPAIFLGGGAAYAQAPEWVDPVATLAQEREDALGIERAYISLLEFAFTLPADLATPEFVEEGPFTWRYDGQQVFAVEPVRAGPVVTFVEPDFVLNDSQWDPAAYFGVGTAHRVDQYGRRWVLEAVDATMGVIDEVLLGDNGDVSSLEWNPDAGVEHTFLLTQWDTVNCGGPDQYFDHVQNGGMSKVHDPLPDHLRSMVLVQSGSVHCSGVFVEEHVVLTAAHCVTDASGVEHPPTGITVCTMENLDENTDGGDSAACFGATHVQPMDGWEGQNPYRVHKDAALLFLDGYADTGTMKMNTAKDSKINGEPSYHQGYPAFERDCVNSNFITDPLLTVVDGEVARHLYSASGDVQGTPSGWIKWDVSTAVGASGGPHYWCPTGYCPDKRRITGLAAVQHLSCPWDSATASYQNPPCASGYQGGPKGRSIEDWVAATIASIAPPAVVPPPDPEHCGVPDTWSNPIPYAEIPAADLSDSCIPGGHRVGLTTCEDTIVYANVADCDKKGPLFVYLPGTEKFPKEQDHVLQIAADVGYRVIGLANENHDSIQDACDGNKDQCLPLDANQDLTVDYRDECVYIHRAEKVTGADDQGDPNAQTTGMGNIYEPFPVQDSVLYRLFHTLEWLDDYDNNRLPGGVGDNVAGDQCDWDQFINDLDGLAIDGVIAPGGVIPNAPWPAATATMMGAVDWNKIVLAGWSQGAGNSIWVGLHEEVLGMVLLDGATDTCDVNNVPQTAGYYAGMTANGYPSDGAGKFGAWHEDSSVAPAPDRQPSWDRLGLLASADQDWDDVAPLLISLTVKTNQEPPNVCSNHESMALGNDDGSCLPIAETGGVGADGAELTYLFEAYWQGFCEAGL